MLAGIKKGIAEMSGAEPLTALADLSTLLDTAKGAHEEGLRGEGLSLIQEASGAHVSALLAQIIARPTSEQAVRATFEWVAQA